MGKVEVTPQIKQSDVWGIAFAAIFMTLVVLVIATVMFWDQICARIMITALECGAEQALSSR